MIDSPREADANSLASFSSELPNMDAAALAEEQ